MKSGETNDKQLWAEVEMESRRTKREACGPYDCKELLAFLAAHPEKESALLRAYINKQRGILPPTGATTGA